MPEVPRETQLKVEDLKPGDILRDANGVLWNFDQAIPDGMLVVQRRAVYDLTGWEKVDSYHITGKGSGS